MEYNCLCIPIREMESRGIVRSTLLWALGNSISWALGKLFISLPAKS